MIEAKIICDSVSPGGHRLTTFQLRYPKFIHGELMTHRVFSRNASSSRAVPTARLLEEVRSDDLRATFVHWGKNQPGMGTDTELTGADRAAVEFSWKCAALEAADRAETMRKHGAAKQLVNRLLEPFSHINVIVTSTDYLNFFGLRLHFSAQPEMRALAVRMFEEYTRSTPAQCLPGSWHLPFVGLEDAPAARQYLEQQCGAEVIGGAIQNLLIKVSVARCARVSYLSFETGKRSTVEEDLKLYAKLVEAKPIHASPAEHQATPDEWVKFPNYEGYAATPQWGNFFGWRQYRKMLAGEDRAPLPEGYHAVAHLR